MSSEKEKFNLTNWEIVSVNPVDKNWDWKDMFCFWSVGLQSIMSFALIASLYFVYNLNFYEVLFGSLLASLLVIYLSYIIGKPSQKHGIPFPVFLRVSTGAGIEWWTPVGPLNMTFSHAIQKKSTDEFEGFQFNIGTTF